MLRNFLKVLLNRSNISSNITKKPFWMKYWIGLTERKNSKKRKVMFDEEKLCWMKIWLRANVSSNIFRLIQQNFHVGLVYSLFHPAFHSYDVISNVGTLNFEWFNKTKTLCKIITIKKIMHIKWKWTKQQRKFWPST